MEFGCVDLVCNVVPVLPSFPTTVFFAATGAGGACLIPPELAPCVSTCSRSPFSLSSVSLSFVVESYGERSMRRGGNPPLRSNVFNDETSEIFCVNSPTVAESSMLIVDRPKAPCSAILILGCRLNSDLEERPGEQMKNMLVVSYTREERRSVNNGHGWKAQCRCALEVLRNTGVYNEKESKSPTYVAMLSYHTMLYFNTMRTLF